MIGNRHRLIILVAITLSILIVPAAVGLASTRDADDSCGNLGSNCVVSPARGASADSGRTGSNTGRSGDVSSASPSPDSASSWTNNRGQTIRAPSSTENLDIPSGDAFMGSGGDEPGSGSGGEVLVISDDNNGTGGQTTSGGDVLILTETRNGAR